MALTNEEIDELDMEFVLERESIPFSVSRGVSGVQLHMKTCPNPDCRDDRWRTYFGLDTGFGNCFVCGKGFNKARFVHWHNDHSHWGDTFREITNLLREQGWRPKRAAMVAVDHGEVVLPMSDPIPDEQGNNLAYLETRGIDASIAKYFDLRNCSFGWWRYQEDDTWKMQTFNDRIIVPVFDLDGTLKTFQGRDTTGKSDRKYLFPKGLPGTGRYLLNGHNVIASRDLVMGEGFFDVAAIKIAFDADQNLRDVTAVGSFGKHLSYGDPNGNDQLGRFNALKQRGAKTVTIMWDGEVNALNAALDAAKKLTASGYQTRIALLPFEKDPNEVPAEVVRKAYYAATLWTPAVDMKWRLRNPYSASERVKNGL